jgi:hypothetical protein
MFFRKFGIGVDDHVPLAVDGNRKPRQGAARLAGDDGAFE